MEDPTGSPHSRPDALREHVDQLCCEYPYADPVELLDRTMATRRLLLDLHGRRDTTKVRQDLLAAAGWATLLASCLHQDLGHRAAATAMAGDARSLGDVVGEQRIVAWSWEIAVWQAVTAGRYARAQTYARAAATIAPRSDVAVQLGVQDAKACARMGDEAGVRHALNGAERILDELAAPERPEHHFIFDRSKWSFYALQAFDVLGDERHVAEMASDLYHRCTAGEGATRWPMRLAEAQLALAHAQARSGDLEAAAGYGLQALAHVRQSGPSLLPRALDLDVLLYRRWPVGARTFHGELRRVQERFAPPAVGR